MERLLIRKDLAEKILQRDDLDSYSRVAWEKELKFVNDELVKVNKK